jgi:hypothetical protein
VFFDSSFLTLNFLVHEINTVKERIWGIICIRSGAQKDKKGDELFFAFLFKKNDFSNSIFAYLYNLGAHRLWSHRSYTAKLPLRILLAIFFTLTCQVS